MQSVGGAEGGFRFSAAVPFCPGDGLVVTLLEAIEECPSIGTAVASHVAGDVPGGVGSRRAQLSGSRAKTAGYSDRMRDCPLSPPSALPEA